MNNKRRSKLKKAIEYLEISNDIINQVLDEEQDSLDNIPENFMESKLYQDIENAIDILEESIEHIENVKENLSEF